MLNFLPITTRLLPLLSRFLVCESHGVIPKVDIQLRCRAREQRLQHDALMKMCGGVA